VVGKHCCRSMNSLIRDFSIIKAFLVDWHPKKATLVIQANGNLLSVDGLSNGAAMNDGFLRGTCGGIF